MMASANLDLGRSIYAAWERGDWSSAEWAHPEIEFDIADGPEPGIGIGVTAMAESWRKWLSAWDGYRIEAEEYRELDAERVIVLNRYGGRGKTSGLEIGEAGGTKAATLSTFATTRSRGSSATTTASGRSPTSASRSRPCRRGT